MTHLEKSDFMSLTGNDLIEICGSWLGEERERFYDALDALPLGETQDIAADALEEWQSLSIAVGSRTQVQVHEFAQREYERLQLDPELAELHKLGAELPEAFGGFAEELASCCRMSNISNSSVLVGGAVGASSSVTSCSAIEWCEDVSETLTSKKRERGMAWSEQEHKLFLLGLQRFGKGDWRSISRQCVITRTPAQVASHAQKYFLRQDGNSIGRSGRRVSIHDISSVGDTLPPRNQRKRSKKSHAAPHNSGSDRLLDSDDHPSIGSSAVHVPSVACATSTHVKLQPALQWAPVQHLPSGPRNQSC